MSVKQQFFLFFTVILFLSFSSCLTPFRSQPFKIGPAAGSYTDKYTRTFHFENRTKRGILRIHVANEAVINFQCYLYPNSTSNITLLLEPKDQWNLTQVMVGIGQEINKTVKNGVIMVPPNDDVSGYLNFYAQVENESEKISGVLNVVKIFRGWEYPPVIFYYYFYIFIVIIIILGPLALLLLIVKRVRRPKETEYALSDNHSEK